MDSIDDVFTADVLQTGLQAHVDLTFGIKVQEWRVCFFSSSIETWHWRPRALNARFDPPQFLAKVEVIRPLTQPCLSSLQSEILAPIWNPHRKCSPETEL